MVSDSKYSRIIFYRYTIGKTKEDQPKGSSRLAQDLECTLSAVNRIKTSTQSPVAITIDSLDPPSTWLLYDPLLSDVLKREMQS
jgi:hypothetical protein